MLLVRSMPYLTTSLRHTNSLLGGLSGFVKSLRSLDYALRYNLTSSEPSRGYALNSNINVLELNRIIIDHSWC